jgi:hypothetical protein
MKSSVLVFAVVALLVAWGVHAYVEDAGPPPDDPTLLDGPRLDGLDGWRADLGILDDAILRFWSYVDHRRELSGVDVPALVAAERGRLGDDATAEDFLAAVTRVASGLQDGHAAVIWDGATLDGPRRWPVVLADAVEGVFVLGTLPKHQDSGAILPGDVVISIDDLPVEQLVAEREAYVCASSPGQRRAAAILHMPWSTHAERVRLRLRREGVEAPLLVDVACPSMETVVPALLRGWWNPSIDSEIAAGVAYWRPAGFRPPADSGFADATPEQREAITAETKRSYERIFDSFAETRALILDLRGNPGGTDILGQHLAALLLPQDTTYFQLQGRDEDGAWYRRSAYSLPDAGDREPYPGQLLLLVDENTFSVADNLAACLVDTHPDITVLGRPTAAGTGAPRGFTLPHSGLTLITCSMRVWSPDGRMIEGQGVVPDVPVAWTIADYLEGRDPGLEAALARVRPAGG